MLIILSPAKKLDFKSSVVESQWTQNRFVDEAHTVVNALKKLSQNQLAEIMSLSPALAKLNYERYQDWHLPFSPDNSRQAIYAFNGDAYQGLDSKSLNNQDVEFAQNHLRILSALYGVIRPLDLIQPYRIEMGMKFSFGKYASLYQFWKSKITKTIIEDTLNQGDNIVVNLASEEYFKALDENNKAVQYVHPVFKEFSNGQYKIVSQKAKRARGLMSRFIIQNRISDPEEIKLFDLERYFFSEKQSTKNQPVFTR